MLDTVISFSLRYRSLVLVASLVVLVYGSYLASTMPVDVFPDLDRPRVVIITEAPGLATEEVETLVTQPLEIALMGANGVEAVRSQTTAGLNVLYVEFDWKTEIRSARQTVSERLTTLAGILPEGITPQMTPPSSIMGQIVVAGIYYQKGPSGGTLTPIDQTSFVAELIESADKPELKIWRVTDRHLPHTWIENQFELVQPLQRKNESPQPAYRATIKLNSQPHEVTFVTPSQQLLELRTIADWVIRPRLLKVSGVAEVFMQGGDRKQYQVLLDPAALLEYDVSVQDVEQALRESNINTSGGFAIQGESERPIRILGRLGTGGKDVVSELLKSPVSQNLKRSILLEQVASVVEGPELKRGDGSINGQSGIVFTAVKQPHIDTRQLTDRIATAFTEVESSLPPNIVINSELFRLKNFIDRGIFNVAEALAIGATLVVIVLFLFLLNFRTTFITLTAIPMSLVMTAISFKLISWLSGNELSINVMTLGGIAVAMGELVDDAIVDVENIYRRLKMYDCRSEESKIGNRKSEILSVVYEASKEIRSSIVFGTAVVILVFLPLFALSGIEGRLFAPLGFAYIVSILSSFVVSIIVTPVLSYYLLPSSKSAYQESDSLVLRQLKAIASPLIRFSMFAPGMLVLLTWIVFGIAAWQITQLGRNFLPAFDEGSIQVNVTLPPGSSLQASNKVSTNIDTLLQSMQKSELLPDGEILNFVRRTGRAQMDEHASPVNVGEYILSMNPAAHRNRDELISRLRSRINDEVPGVSIEVEQPLAHMISHMISGVYAQIAIKVYGDDLDTLLSLADQIKTSIQAVPGITPPMIEPIQMTSELHIQLRGDDLALHGLSRQYVASVLQTALQGQVVSEVLQGQRRFDLLVRLEEAHRTDYANLGSLRIDLPHQTGQEERGQIELRDVATINEGSGPNSINRENARRRIVIRCNTEGRDLSSTVAELKTKIESGVTMPVGYYLEFGGQFESQQSATRLIMLLAGISILGMFGVLMILFPSLRIVLQILNALPTAFIGGVFALVITDQSITVASLVGFISLGGIAVRNGILLMTHYVHLMRSEGESFSKSMILRGSLERLAPVLMTALTAGIGLVPLVIGGQEPGREILYPVATVILGGLITSTFCEFLIHPGLFWKFSGEDAKRLANAEELSGI
ncbi:MAG: efflux RND transporter permease subunit [Pirellula sp.]|nr:efflux RND transporter permease subunit [Pirellula sp.]